MFFYLNMNKFNCIIEMCKHKIYTQSDFRKWALINHPDKGGNEDLFSKINNCSDINIFCKNLSSLNLKTITKGVNILKENLEINEKNINNLNDKTKILKQTIKNSDPKNKDILKKIKLKLKEYRNILKNENIQNKLYKKQIKKFTKIIKLGNKYIKTKPEKEEKQLLITYPNNKQKLSKKQVLVDSLFKPDKEGVSDWVSRETISNIKELNWGNNGCGRHGVYFGDNRYNWEKKGLRSIEALRTIGFNENVLYGKSRPIRKDIDKYHKKIGCVVCGSKSDLVTDHKNDLYNDERVLNRKTQVLDDFQCLCNHCNLQKRQVAKKTKETGKRYGATNISVLKIFGIDFTSGNETYDKNDINAMVGTFWYDPIEFCKNVKKIICS